MPNIFSKTCEEENNWETYMSNEVNIKIDFIGMEYEQDSCASKWSPITVYV